jgi:hypothetical protein
MNTVSLLTFLAGTWFVCSTDFPMWTGGKKTDPQFHYTITEKRGRKVLYDEVTYLKKGRQKTIRGYDYPESSDNSAFSWRGKGLLSIVKSEWKVALKDPGGQWAVIYFPKRCSRPKASISCSERTSPIPKRSLLLKDRWKACLN